MGKGRGGGVRGEGWGGLEGSRRMRGGVGWRVAGG